MIDTQDHYATIEKLTAQRDRLLEALKERVGFYYQRGVPHQSQHPHCQCRPCVDSRVSEAIKGGEGL